MLGRVQLLTGLMTHNPDGSSAPSISRKVLVPNSSLQPKKLSRVEFNDVNPKVMIQSCVEQGMPVVKIPSRKIMIVLEIKGPLVIDLDGTLIKCTSFKREIQDVFRRHGLLYLLRTVFRERIFSRSKLKLLISDLTGPISYLRCIRGEIRQLIDCHLSAGGEVMIASAAAPRSVQTVLRAAGLSSLPVLASSSDKNMKGSRKAKAILIKYGDAEFTYIGDSVADLPVFNAATVSYLVCPKLSVAIGTLLNPRAQVIQLFLKNEKCLHDN